MKASEIFEGEDGSLKRAFEQTIESPSVPMAHMPKDNIEEIVKEYNKAIDQGFDVPSSWLREALTKTHNNTLRLAVESLGSLHSNEVWGEETIKVLYEITNSWIKNIKELEI